MGHGEALSRTLEQDFKTFLVPLRRGIGWDGLLYSIFQVWSDKGFVQGEKNTGGKGRKGSLQIKLHPTGFIGSADDIISSTAPGV